MKLFNRKPVKAEIGLSGGLMSGMTLNSKPNYLIEALKGLVLNRTIRHPTELGLEHPFNLSVPERLMKKFGVVNSVVDKHLDFIFSSGINITSEDKRAKEVIDNFMRDFNFLTTIKPWVKEALSKGTGYLEIGTDTDSKSVSCLKTLKSDYMYVNRTDTGMIEGYNQYTKPIKGFNMAKDGKEIQQFELNEIAYLTINRFSDNAYGLGIVYPLISIIDDLVGSRKELHTLMRRKANNPFIFLMGDKASNKFPAQGDMDALKTKLQDLNNCHDWVLSDLVKPMTLDFGDIGGKFQFVIENDLELLYMASQIPALLMGTANINQGIAKEQMKAWMFRISSMREEIEKVIEESIFKVILASHGIKSHVEIIWGLPNQEEKNEKLTILNEIVKNPFLAGNLRVNIEKEIANLLDITLDDVNPPKADPVEPPKDTEETIIPVKKHIESDIERNASLEKWDQTI